MAERPSKLHNYDLNTELSNPNIAVYTNNKKAIVSFRGTDPSNIYDLSLDALIISGFDLTTTSRFQEARYIINDLIAEGYGGKIDVVGHSLGSVITRGILLENPETIQNAYLFSEPAQLLYNYPEESPEISKKIFRYSGQFDPISRLGLENVHVGLLAGHELPNENIKIVKRKK